MAPLDLSNIQFTRRADKVYSDSGIYNRAGSDVKTLQGADEIIGNNSINSSFGFEVIAKLEAEDAGGIAAADISGKANVRANGINNKGSISTNRGQDIVRGTATANIFAQAHTASEAIAYANQLDTTAVAATFANIDVNAIANGINNSGTLGTGKGNDSVDGDIDTSIVAVATAQANAAAIVEAIAQAPVNDNLEAFALAIAKSIANAEVIATGVNNSGGKFTTMRGGDTINAVANSASAILSEVSASALSGVTGEGEALALAVAEAVARVQDKAIAIDNTGGSILTGKGHDTIKATANGVDKAIAIENTNGIIDTGNGDDSIEADANGSESYDIFGGTINMGKGADRIQASSFGGGVNIKMGNGKDFVEGFGDAIVNGGKSFDILSLDSFNLDDFNISLGATNENEVSFERDGITMTTSNFEQFNFGNGSSIFTYDDLVASV
jgi:hypothetical protein